MFALFSAFFITFFFFSFFFFLLRFPEERFTCSQFCAYFAFSFSLCVFVFFSWSQCTRNSCMRVGSQLHSDFHVAIVIKRNSHHFFFFFIRSPPERSHPPLDQKLRITGCGRLWPVQFWPIHFWPKLEVSGLWFGQFVQSNFGQSIFVLCCGWCCCVLLCVVVLLVWTLPTRRRTLTPAPDLPVPDPPHPAQDPTSARPHKMETCLIVGLLPLMIILITASLSSNTYNKAS